MNWEATVEEILVERRQRFGKRPSTDEMIALRAGELSDEERQRLLEHASVDPDVARDLLDLLRFPEMPAGEEPPDEGEGLDDRWQALRKRLVTEGYLPEDDPAPTPVPVPVPIGTRILLPLAASFLIGVAAALAFAQFRALGGGTGAPADPQINMPIVELLPVADEGPVMRGGEIAIVPGSASGLVLTLAVPGLAPTVGPGGYGLVVTSGEGETVFWAQGLIPVEGSVFVLVLPRHRLADGAHVLLLSDGHGQPVGRFRLEVELRQ